MPETEAEAESIIGNMEVVVTTISANNNILSSMSFCG